jgi:subtilisin-like proprotein convertase family protein
VTTDTITSTDVGTIIDLNVTIDIDHTWIGDLDVFLTSPTGTQVELFTDVGLQGDYIDVLLDDDASATLPETTTDISGSYHPEGSLADFIGEDIDGAWTLTVTDDQGGDEGILNGWGLSFEIADGSSGLCAAADCLDMLTTAPSTPDGAYWLDPLGTGATLYECDMTNGGWTEVFYNDVDFQSPEAGWTMQSTYDCAGSVMLGGYNNIAGGLIEVTVDTSGVPHTEARVEAVYWSLDSWDTEDGWIDIDGTNIFAATRDWHTTGQALCGNTGRTDWVDESYPVDQTLAHTAGSLLFSAGSNLNDTADDESFGVADVVIWVR